MAIDLNNSYQRKDGSSASNVYYGYTWKANASDSEKVFAIRRVQTINGIENVTWSNGDPTSYNDSWSGRTFSFTSPSTSIGLSGTWSVINGSNIGTFTWSAPTGVSRFVITAMGSPGLINEFGFVTNTRDFTAYVTNQTSWIQTFPTGGTWSFTVRAMNSGGSTQSTITLNF